MMRWLVLLCCLTLSGPTLANSVLPRLSPLPLVSDDGGDAGAVKVAFGQRLEVLKREGALLTVVDDAGRQMRLRASDVLETPRVGLALTPAEALASPGSGRPDLSLWDSGLRARAYLGGAVTGALAPPLLIPSDSDLSTLDVPVFSVDRVATLVGGQATLVGALLPVRLGALDPADGASRHVMLHVLVDGSAGSRSFTLETLRRLSRSMAEGPDGASRFSRQVLFETGALRDEGEVPASGLRAQWPDPAGTGDPGGLTGALARAVERLADGIDPADATAHVVLVLVGPGLTQDGPARAALDAAGRRLAALRAAGADLRGVMLVQGTPEPNPANAAVLARLSGGAETHLLGFGEDLAAGLSDLIRAPARGAEGFDPAALCPAAAAAGLPCVLPAPGGLPLGIAPALAGQAPAEWVALQLWLVAEAAPFDLVPAGMPLAEARAAQADIRACHAAGQVWDVAAAACGPRQDEDAKALLVQLDKLQAEIGSRVEERDAVIATLAQRDAEWQAERADLGTRLAAAAADRNTALADVRRHAATIASQSADVDEHRQRVAAQAERLDGLSAELVRRSADLQAAADRIETLRREGAETAEALGEAQAELRALDAERVRLAWSLEEMTQAKDSAEARAATLDRRLAVSQTEIEGLTALHDDLSVRLFATEGKLAAAQADREARATALEADLRQEKARADDLDRQLAAAQAGHEARTTVLEAELEKALAGSEAVAQELARATERVEALEALSQDLSRAANGTNAKLALLTEALTEERRNREALQAERAVLQAQVLRLTTERDSLAATTAAADLQLATLQADRNAFAAKVVALEADAAARADALRSSQAKAPVEVKADPAQNVAQTVDREVAKADPLRRPKPRPAAPAAQTGAPQPVTGPNAPIGAKDPALARAALRPTAPAAPLTRVAPSQSAPGLSGCQFQWSGQEGRLVCP